MSHRFTLNLFLVFLLTIATTGCSFFSSKKSQHHDHQPQEVEDPHGHNFRKITAPIALAITSSAEPPVVNESFELNLAVSSNLDLENLELEWHIPDGVEILEGNLKESFSIEQGQERVFTVTLKASSEQNQQIHARVKSANGKLSNTTQYNTKFQKQIEESAERLNERRKEYEESKQE